MYLFWNAENAGLDVDSETVQIGTDVMDDDNVRQSELRVLIQL